MRCAAEDDTARLGRSMSELSILGGAAVACLLGGVLPWISSEVVVVGAALVLPAELLPALVFGCAVTQMTSKSALYGLTRLAPHRLPRKAQRLLSGAGRLAKRKPTIGTVVLTGAMFAVPPFYLVTVACGVLRVPFASFALLGLVGTTARYGVLAWLSLTLGGS